MNFLLARNRLASFNFAKHAFKAGVGAILVFFSCGVFAEDGVYVGPYDRYYFGTNVFSTEAAALADLKDTTIKLNGLCNYSAAPESGEWFPRDIDNKIVFVEGKVYRTKLYKMNGDQCQLFWDIQSVLERRRSVCHTEQGMRFFTPVQRCRPGHPEIREDSKGGNVGKNCPNCDVAEPITPATGNMWHLIIDYQTPASTKDMTVTRIYNSSPVYWTPNTVRGFGLRWTHSFNKSLTPDFPNPANYGPVSCWRFDTGELECSSYSASLEKIPAQVSVMRPDGKRIVFTRNVGSSYSSTLDVTDRLSAVLTPDGLAVNEWIFSSSQEDSSERFDNMGKLLSITERSGLTQKLTYSDGKTNDTRVGRSPANGPVCASVQSGDVLPEGRLLCVTNHWGRQIQFRYDSKGRITEMLDPANQSYLYEYDGPSGGCIPGNEDTLACKANNLTKVTYPDGKAQTYSYNELSKINGGTACAGLTGMIGNGFGPNAFVNMMTGLVDENDERHISWTYDCSGRATSSELGDGIEKVAVAYTNGSNGPATVTHYVGPSENPTTSVSTFGKTYVQGIAKPTTIDAPCVECGTIAERSYDSIGNVTKTKDFNNNYSCFAYENARRLETMRVEGVATADCAPLLTAQTLALPVRKTTTKWHAQFRQPEVIAEPKRITKYKYDTSGNLLSKSEQATTDLTGVLGLTAPVTGIVRTLTYTYSNVGQLKTVTGSRTDIVDRTSYDYDPSTGDLTKITNAANQVTTFSDYDAHGHVRTIHAPNGVTTTLSYTPRGWVASRAVSNGTLTQMTTYDYTPSGQVKTVTLPDNSVTTYTYDAAHRLTSVSNNRGESITYTLDLTGNRIKETVRDPNGNLTRQITRTYDIIGRLTSQTGAAQ